MKMTAATLWSRTTSIVVVACATTLLAACQSGSSTHAELAPEPDAPPFTAAEYGVEASPKVTNLKKVAKGGGREHVGKPYKVRGKWYYPKEEPDYSKSGVASWYGSNFHGRLTANGEVYDMYHLSAAHPTFPLPSYARVTNTKNGNSVLVRVNDRGPFAHGRIVDVSSKAADILDFKNAGTAQVKVEYVGRAPVDGDDTQMLMASFRPGNAGSESDGLPSGVMMASADMPSDEMLVASAFAGSNTAVSGEMPGVRSMQAIQKATSAQKAKQQPAGGFAMPAVMPAAASAPAFAPIPTPRTGVLSYASEGPKTGAFKALSALANGGETIEIGILSDAATIERIETLAKNYGQVTREAVPAEMGGGVSLSLTLAESGYTDMVLGALWANGANDAFALKN